jgi:hypothetical protein
MSQLSPYFYYTSSFLLMITLHACVRGRHGRDCMVVGFTTTYAIDVYHHWCCGFDSRSRRGVQHYVIVCQWLAADRWGFPVTLVSSNNKTDRHNITEKIFLKVALSTIKQTYKHACVTHVTRDTFHSKHLSSLSSIFYYFYVLHLPLAYIYLFRLKHRYRHW